MKSFERGSPRQKNDVPLPLMSTTCNASEVGIGFTTESKEWLAQF